MAYCKNCGLEIDDKATVCTHCGAEQTPKAPVQDNGGFLWGLLGWCIPIVGLILLLVWKDTKPRTSRAAGIGALVSVLMSVVFCILAAVLGIGAGLMGL